MSEQQEYKPDPISDWESDLIKRASGGLGRFSKPFIIGFYLFVIRGVPVLLALAVVMGPFLWSTTDKTDKQFDLLQLMVQNQTEVTQNIVKILSMTSSENCIPLE